MEINTKSTRKKAALTGLHFMGKKKKKTFAVKDAERTLERAIQEV